MSFRIVFHDICKGIGISRRLPIVTGLIFLLIASMPAEASIITPTDYDAAFRNSIGVMEGSPVTSVFTSLGGIEIADITGSVYYNHATALYTYELFVNPEHQQTHNISFFKTDFLVQGFDPSTMKAGYDFSQAVAAGVDSGFYIWFRDEPWITYEKEYLEFGINGEAWEDPFPITFFFQSSVEPGLDTYSLINAHTGSAENYAPEEDTFPIPEPGTFTLVFTGIAGITAFSSRLLKRKDS